MGDIESGQRKKFPWWVVILIGVGCLGIGIVILGILAALLLPALASARQAAKATDCRNNLRQLGMHVFMYTAKYGGDEHYPPAPGLGFWETLRKVPNEANAVCPPAQSRNLFLCKVWGSPGGRSAVALDYTAPDFENLDAYPAGALTDRVHPDVFIAGDVVADPQPNHGTFRYNALRFDGRVEAVEPGSPDDSTYRSMTTGVRAK